MAANGELSNEADAPEEVDWVNANVPLAPQGFYDPISGGVLKDPVVAGDGQVYSRATIEAHLDRQQAAGLPTTSPHSGELMGTDLAPNNDIRAALEEFRSANDSKPPPLSGDGLGSGEVHSLRDLGRIFARLDRLRDILATTLEGWQPPQLVVLGGESSGKSTLLGRLTMMPIFPSHDNLCTRLPIHVSLRRCSVLKPPRLEVRDSATGKVLEGPYEIPMGAGQRAILAKMEELVWSEENQQRGVHTGRLLAVHVDSPSVPSLDLVDLPGLVQSPQEMAEATEKLVRRYIQSHNVHSIFLATVPAAQKPNDSKALALAHQLGVADRTVGVITMCDELPRRRHGQLRERIASPPGGYSEEDLQGWLKEAVVGDAVRLRNGYVATSNEPLQVGEEGSDGVKLESHYSVLNEQARLELRWFQDNDMQDLVEGGQATCNQLVGRINTMFVEYIRETWVPVTIFKLNQEAQQLEFLNACLGLPEANGALSADALHSLRVTAVAHMVQSLEAALPQMMQGFSAVLAELREQLVDIVPRQQTIRPDELEERWFSLSDAIMAACAEACQEQDKFWMREVRAVLSRRMEQPAWPSPEAWEMVREQPLFQPSRFPQVIERVMQRLSEVMQGEQRESIEGAVDTFLGRFFDELLPHPHVSIRPNVSASPATVRISCDSGALADALVLVFLRHGLALVRKGLLPAMGDVAASVSSWQESCAGEREALRERLVDVRHALERVRHLLRPVADATDSDSTSSMESQVSDSARDLLRVSMARCELCSGWLHGGPLVIGAEATVEVQAVGEGGEALTSGGLSFQVTLFEQQLTTGNQDDEQGAEDEPLASSRAAHVGGGLYRATLAVPEGVSVAEAPVSVSVELHGSPLAGSPFQAVLTPVSPSNCDVRGEGLREAEPGVPAAVEVIIKDVGGRVLPLPGLPLHLRLLRSPLSVGSDSLGAAVEVESSVEYAGAGCYAFSFTIDGSERAESLSLSVTLHGSEVGGGPFPLRVKLSPLEMTEGVLHDFCKAKLAEWSVCYDQPYDHPTMMSDFPTDGEWLFVCAALEGSDVATLGAFGRRQEVMCDHTGNDCAAHPHHGAYWYWRPNRSVGFSSVPQISLNHADTCEEFTEDRLSWHFNQAGNGGWRVGDVKGLEKFPGRWRKQIYVWPARR